MIIYLSLFFTALGAATLLPGGSEAHLLYLKYEGHNSFLLLVSASLGNTLGSVVNYLLGKYATSWAIQKNYVKSESIKKSKGYFDKYGAFALLLAWTPIIGDPITFVAGILRYSFWKFLLFVTAAKAGRYAFLLYLYEIFV